ncbi:MAG: hypothetical protein H6917_16775 [Novosphingobium sp.]|nr:O-fucosyltransferase family protein [Novosphingobium sp.]MCP5404028.1 hypothetical protein [Novosphingobium sp.]
MKPLLERWCGHRLEPSKAYGIRIYRQGNVLHRHVDLVETHVISASILVAQDVDQPWPLVIEQWDGTRQELALNAGEAVLYEGAKLPHFRDSQLQGRCYANIFVHFRPLWWRYTSVRVERLLADLPPRYPSRSLAYGQSVVPAEGPAAFPPGAAKEAERKYLAFETDFGGWNNILMQFEIMVMLAWLTGRTLVLPPATPFYLLGQEARRLEDFLDLAELQSRLPALTAEEFVAETGLEETTAQHEGFHTYMRAHGHCPQWNALEDVLVCPGDALQQRPELAERVLDRRIVAYGGEAEACDLLYFPMDVKHRMFGVAEAFFLHADTKRECAGRALLRDAVRFRKDLLALAERALESPALAGGNFAALHVRRGDFQYEKTQISAREILEHIEALLESGQTVYLATDEPESEFFAPLRERFCVVTFERLLPDVVEKTPDHWRGIVETLICAGAPGRFIGTRLSTFTARIQLLRGHLSHTPGGDCEGIDTALYYTQPPLWAAKTGDDRPYAQPSGKHVDEFGETAETWWQSCRRVPIWGRAYREVWAETED